MTAYWIARAKINDPVEYKKYTDRIPEIPAKYHGEVLSRGGEYKMLEGPKIFERFIVIKFPSPADAETCFNSDEYQSAAVFRRAEGVAQNELTIVASGDATG
jgi:uncharacterized protein (DUF1330 family)